MVLGGYFTCDTGRGIGQHNGADKRYQQHHKGIDQIEPVLDAPRGAPAAESIREGSTLEYPAEQHSRQPETSPADGEDEGEDQPSGQQHAERCRCEWQRDLQCGQVAA